MVFLQFGWGRFTGTEDLYIEDCMKLQNEPKRVKTSVVGFLEKAR